MSRTLLDNIQELLGRSELRGKHLAEALERIAPEHGGAPFQACLGLVSVRPRTETEARAALQAIETHRTLLEQRLGRDPGFLVAAVDHLGDREAGGMSRSGAPGARAPVVEAPFEDRLEAEVRRSERTGRPLVLALLAPRGPVEDLSIEAAAMALERARRDVDVLVRLLPPGFGVILPSIGVAAGERAAARLVEIAARASGADWCAGVAERRGDGSGPEDLAAAALRALRRARSGDRAVAGALVERRRHRRAAGTALTARLEAPHLSSPADVVDLSAGGVRLRTPVRLPEGTSIRLDLRGPAPRAHSARIEGRLLRRDVAGDDAAVLLLDESSGASPELAALLAGLPMSAREGRA